MAKTTTSPSIDHLAKLAGVLLTTTEKDQLSPQIGSIVDSVKQVQSLDLANFPTTNQVTNKTNEFREDIVTPSLTQQQALSGSRKTHNGYFVVSAVINPDAV